MREGAFADVPIAAVERFWDEHPCNIRHSPRPIGTREYFDDVERRKYFVEPHIPTFAEFDRWRGKRVLEIGCGIGTATMSFARAGAQVTAVDLSTESAELARRRAAVFGLSDRVSIHVGNAEQLSSIVPVEPYDLVFSFGVIHHSPHPERIVREARRYMNADSEFRLMVYSRVSYKLFWIMQQERAWDMSRIDELIAKNSEAQTGCPVTYTYTPDSVRALLLGFDVLEISKAHIFTWDVEAYRRFEYKKDPAWAGVSDEELAALERELGWHMLVRAVPSR
jgi:ubiquinone/menaquinone biosynthesis C-methylase UbiE